MATSQPDHSLDGQSSSELMIGLSISLVVLCTVAVGARIYTRTIMLNNAGLDDLMIVITQFFALGLNITTILEARWGVGRHSWVSSPGDGERQLQSLFAAIQLYIWSLCLVKVSLLVQYRRIFMVQWLQRTSIVLIAIAVVWNMAQSVLVSFGCVPMGLLRPWMADTCLDSLTIWYIAAGMNISTDFIVFLIPIPLINSLQLPTRQKVLLFLVFCLGFFTCIISIVRATTLYSAVSLNDPSWYGTPAAVWSMVEVNCAILCSCLPTIRYFLAIIFPCLGLRSEQSRYPGDPFRSSQRAVSGGGGSMGFALRSRRRSNGAQRALGLGARSSRTAASRASVAAAAAAAKLSVSSRSRSHVDAAGPADDLDMRWGVDYEKGGPQYHSNHISTWVRTGAVTPEASSPTSSAHRAALKRPSVDDGSSERGLVEPAGVAGRPDNRELVNHILITRDMEMVVEEARADETVIAFPARAL